MNKTDLKGVLEETAAQRGVTPEVLLGAICTGMTFAAQKKTGLYNIKAVFDDEKGSFGIVQTKTVQPEVNDPVLEMTLEEAHKYDENAKTGDVLTLPYPFPELGRLAARTTRRTMQRTLDEIESFHEFEENSKQKHKLAVAIVRVKTEEGDYLCEVANKQAVLPLKEQAFRESFGDGEVIKTLIVDITRKGNDSIFILSRTHPLLLRFLLTREVPEIAEGLVEIKAIARDTAGRSKVAVYSSNPGIDAQGACIGPKGERIRRVTAELKGENIDIIPWSERPEEFIAASLTPAKVKSVRCNTDKQEAVVALEPDQQARAVGKKGLNIRLASHLTHWAIRVG